MPGFLEVFVEDKARQRIVRDIAIIESEWPAFQASLLGSAAKGFIGNITSGSCSCLMSVPSSRWFKPRTIWLTNNNTANNKLFMYVGGSNAGDVSATLGEIWIGPRETGFIALDGITVDSDIHVSCLVPSLGVRIAGILLKSAAQ